MITRSLLAIATLLYFANPGYASPNKTCEWDGLRKLVWVDDFDQSGVNMAYPLPTDIFIRRLAPELSKSDGLIIDSRLNYSSWPEIHSARQKAQIVIRPKLLLSQFKPDASFLGAEFGGKTSVAMQISIFDNLSQTEVRNLNFGGSLRVLSIVSANSQVNLHDQTLNIIDNLMSDIVKPLFAEFDCIPYATRVTVNDANDLLIGGGQRNNIRPKMAFAILADSDTDPGSAQAANIAFKHVSDAVITIVNPNVSYAKPSTAIGQSHKSMIATMVP